MSEQNAQFAMAMIFGNVMPHCVARSTPLSLNNIVLPIFPGAER